MHHRQLLYGKADGRTDIPPRWSFRCLLRHSFLWRMIIFIFKDKWWLMTIGHSYHHIYISIDPPPSRKLKNNLIFSLIVFVCFNYKYEITHPCCIWASSGNDDTDRWRMISLEEGHWPFGFLSDYHQREEKPRENQWSAVLPCGASSSTTKQNQGGFRFAEGLVVTVSSLKVPTDNLLEEKNLRCNNEAAARLDSFEDGEKFGVAW